MCAFFKDSMTSLHVAKLKSGILMNRILRLDHEHLLHGISWLKHLVDLDLKNCLGVPGEKRGDVFSVKFLYIGMYTKPQYIFSY